MKKNQFHEEKNQCTVLQKEEIKMQHFSGKKSPHDQFHVQKSAGNKFVEQDQFNEEKTMYKFHEVQSFKGK